MLPYACHIMSYYGEFRAPRVGNAPQDAVIEWPSPLFAHPVVIVCSCIESRVLVGVLKKTVRLVVGLGGGQVEVVAHHDVVPYFFTLLVTGCVFCPNVITRFFFQATNNKVLVTEVCTYDDYAILSPRTDKIRKEFMNENQNPLVLRGAVSAIGMSRRRDTA